VRAVVCIFAATLLSAQTQPPGTVFSTYFGGGGYEIPGSVAADREGNIYLTGRTDSTDFPV
jgi:hypothetical protein